MKYIEYGKNNTHSWERYEKELHTKENNMWKGRRAGEDVI